MSQPAPAQAKPRAQQALEDKAQGRLDAYLPALRRVPTAGYVCPLGPQGEQRLNCGWKPRQGESEGPTGTAVVSL